jgi:hypothetical protein
MAAAEVARVIRSVGMRVTEDELILAAHYGFTRRLSDVIAATLTYQRDKRTHDRCAAEAEDSARVARTARRLHHRLPPGLGLRELAEAQDARAQRELARAAERMRASADVFFDTVGGAVPDAVSAMEATNYALDRSKLLHALRDRAALGYADAA